VGLTDAGAGALADSHTGLSNSYNKTVICAAAVSIFAQDGENAFSALIRKQLL
jgi:hypothetical protein